MKRTISIMLTLVLMLSTVLNVAVSAASYPSLSASSYCEFTAAKKMTVYVDSNFSKPGTSNPYKKYDAYIAKNDVCYIYKITSSYAHVNYPTSSGRKTGYIKTKDLLGDTINPKNSFNAKNKVTTLKYKNGATTGYYEPGDTVYNISGVNYNVIYTAKSGKRAYKLAYIKTTASPQNNNGSSIELNVPLYKQTDRRWKNVYIGNKTIGQIGCTTTAIAMVYSYNKKTTVYPNSMKSKLKYSNNDLIWSSIANVGLTSKAYNCGVHQDMLSTIYSKLKSGRPVIIGATTSSGGSQHWVVITGYKGSTESYSTAKFIVNDPGSQNSKTLAEFLANGSKADRTIIKRIMY